MVDGPLTTQESLALVYGRVIGGIAGTGGLLAILYSLAFGWPGGYLIGMLGFLSVLHAHWQMHREVPTPEMFLVVDSLVITACAVVVRLPLFVAVSFAYAYVATAIFTTGRRSGLFYLHVTGLLAVAFAVTVWAPPVPWTGVQETAGDLISVTFFLGAITVLSRAAVQRFRQVETYRAVVAGKVSHELRNALTGAVGIGDLLAESLRAGTCTPADLADLVPPMVAAGHDAAAIVEDLLTVTGAQRGSLDVHVEPTEIGDAITAALGTLPQAFVSRVDVTAPRGLTALADPLRLRQILRNLLTNADRYGGPSVRVTSATDGATVTVSVADDGDGIPPSDADSVFLDYRKAVGSREFAAGIGLGLSVGRQLAVAMGGSLRYRRAGDWTCFDLTLQAVAVRSELVADTASRRT